MQLAEIKTRGEDNQRGTKTAITKAGGGCTATRRNNRRPTDIGARTRTCGGLRIRAGSNKKRLPHTTAASAASENPRKTNQPAKLVKLAWPCVCWPFAASHVILALFWPSASRKYTLHPRPLSSSSSSASPPSPSLLPPPPVPAFLAPLLTGWQEVRRAGVFFCTRNASRFIWYNNLGRNKSRL